MRRVRVWMVVAVLAALVTAILPFITESGIVEALTAPLMFGLILASVPFGGLHNAPPVIPLTVLASTLNATIWGGAFWLEARRRDRRP